MQQHERLLTAQALNASLQHILQIHRTDFPAAQRPVAPEPPVPDRAGIYRHYEKQALAGIGLLQRSARVKAKQDAAAWTVTEVARQHAVLESTRGQWQHELDEQWRMLCANDPDVVLATLTEAFGDNEAAAAPVGIDGAEVSLVVLVPQVDDVIPEQMPEITASTVRFKKLTQTARADYYKWYVCGQVLVTVREAFAVSPALARATVAVLRDDGREVFGARAVSCLLAATVHRDRLDRVQWHQDDDSAAILNAVTDDVLLNVKGRTKALHPVDLSGEAEIAALIAAVDLDELTN
ncbi:hypothetical protein Apa02nite_066310 [Actinoplanes palleronii]|uniref:Uncharacterized protein n=2 Tax=Actinoplanes palleronii TaxID=113570 RepID=A0ABQ4BIL2_9ACTN|nr:hypothetical protein Apa02nite_066310 [Actinoplanes palleronii]